MHLLPTATSAEESERRARVAVLPIGSFEQHGDHLPLATDAMIASVVANLVATKYDLFLLPPLTISCSHEHGDFAGTVSISARTLIDTIADIRTSLSRTGISRLVLVNGHGGNYVLSNIVQEANAGAGEPRVALFPRPIDYKRARERAGMETTTSEDMHGGEWETSILLHTHPELVRPTYLKNDHEAPGRSNLLILGMAGYTDSGIIGKPSLATAEKGQAALDFLVDTFYEVLKIINR